MSTTLARLGVPILLVAVTLTAAVAAQESTIGRAGLAEMIMSAQERAEWEALAAARRDAWLDAFWAGLDPTPGTAENELLTIMRRRAERADRMFADAGGWRSDRGRVLAVLGLPREVERRSPSAAVPPPEIVWTYGGNAEVPELRFTEADGRYLLDTEVSLDRGALVASAREELELLMASGISAAQGLTTTEGATGATTTDLEPDDPSATDAVAPEVRVWMQMVFGGVVREDFDLLARVDTFPAAEGTYTVLSFQLEHAALEYGRTDTGSSATDTAAVETGTAAAAATEAEPRAAVGDPVTAQEGPSGLDLDAQLGRKASRANLKLFGAYLQGEPGQEDTVHAFIVPFTVPEAEAEDRDDPTTLLRSAAVTLTPGTYRLAWGVIDLATGAAATRDDIIDIPDFGGSALQLSRPMLVRPPHRDVTQPMTADEVVRGVRLGTIVLDATIDPLFGRDEIVEVILLASGWQSDPAQPGKPNFEVEYRIISRAEDGTRQAIARLPVQSVDFSVLGQQIPLAQVDRIEPGGSYQIEVRVRDLVTGEQRIAVAPLRIRAVTEPTEGS